MAQLFDSECNVTYLADRIVLTGSPHAVHCEAQKIVTRFIYSSQPLRIAKDTEHEVVLSPEKRPDL